MVLTPCGVCIVSLMHLYTPVLHLSYPISSQPCRARLYFAIAELATSHHLCNHLVTHLYPPLYRPSAAYPYCTDFYCQ